MRTARVDKANPFKNKINLVRIAFTYIHRGDVAKLDYRAGAYTRGKKLSRGILPICGAYLYGGGAFK